MAQREYYLYRTKFIKPAQLPLLAAEKSSDKLLLEAIEERPQYTISSGSEWHLGNINFFDEFSGSFAVGKATKRNVEKFDKETGNFINKLDDSGPNTLVLFDSKIGLLGIAKKSILAPKPQSIARRVKELFQSASCVIDLGVEVRVDVIPDPEDFLEKLRGSFSIKKFRATFTGPNPVDADELFQKPLSVYAREMGASSGVLEVVGEGLNEVVAESVAKSTAATGNTASARIVPEKGEKSKVIKMKGAAVVVSVDSEASSKEALNEMRREYRRIRG